MTTAADHLTQHKPRKGDDLLWAPSPFFSIFGEVASARRDGTSCEVDWRPVSGGYVVRSRLTLPLRATVVWTSVR